jgi:lipopolysaccharide transport system ATP-binding protein
MSEKPAVRLAGAGKMYKLFASRGAHVVDALGLSSLARRRGPRYREFWALRDVDLDVPSGGRLGVIGRNGAGKTTLLKLVTGVVPPTQGTVEVQGDVQALLDFSGGLHPEFTGRENIRAALTFQGFDDEQLGDAEAEIADFAELGEFLDQPFKTYSLGMQARLGFAIATTVEPEVLVVDEMLGAGDAAFFGKSLARMRALVESGATVIMVTHALDQIERFCQDAVWLHDGRVVSSGTSVEVIKEYERFSRELEEGRLAGRNRELLRSDPDGPVVSRWPGERALEIERVMLTDGEGAERTVFEIDTPMAVRVTLAVRADGTFPVIPACLIFREDGLVMTRHVGQRDDLDARAGDRVEAALDLGPLRLGDGRYLVSVGFYRELDADSIDPSRVYDYVDRSYEFRVVGSSRLHNELFRHDGAWELRQVPSERIQTAVEQ